MEIKPYRVIFQIIIILSFNLLSGTIIVDESLPEPMDEPIFGEFQHCYKSFSVDYGLYQGEAYIMADNINVDINNLITYRIFAKSNAKTECFVSIKFINPNDYSEVSMGT